MWLINAAEDQESLYILSLCLKDMIWIFTMWNYKVEFQENSFKALNYTIHIGIGIKNFFRKANRLQDQCNMGILLLRQHQGNLVIQRKRNGIEESVKKIPNHLQQTDWFDSSNQMIIIVRFKTNICMPTMKSHCQER